MKKLLVIVMIMILAVSFAFAQEKATKMDAGLRGGGSNGITGRYFMSESNAIEAIVGWRNAGLVITGLYEFHKPLKIGEVEGLSWFFGGGAHVGFTAWWTTALTLGIDGIIGVGYDLEPLINFPLSVTLDYKPALSFIGTWGTSWGDAAFSIRYTY
ncbi:MAG: hypothetical protein K9N05_06110 [Candidatus Marinimicrobia bacterium]|nr:hypothetical protein [Candidatus Neomarinimicrobiota bacterium]